MKLFKLMACCALLSSLALVGCNKDDDNEMEVEITPVLELGEFTSTKWVASDCFDKEDDEELITDCDSEDGCLKLILNDNNTAELLLQDDYNPVPALFFEGTYVIDGENITVDFRADGMIELWEGQIVENTKFVLSQTDEDTSCLESTTFAK